MSSLYVIIASEGEYSDRMEWVCGVYDNKSNAISMAEEHKRSSHATRLLYHQWRDANWKIRDKWGKENHEMAWKCPYSFVEERIGKDPKRPEADDFTVIEVAPNTWGKWEEIKTETKDDLHPATPQPTHQRSK